MYDLANEVSLGRQVDDRWYIGVVTNRKTFDSSKLTS